MIVKVNIPDRLAKKVSKALGYTSLEFGYPSLGIKDDIVREILNLLEEKYKYTV